MSAPTPSSFPLPADLPAPVDDGASDHLAGMRAAPTPLAATDGSSVDLSAQRGLTIVFCYPRTGAPGETVAQAWNDIPGARGCSPQACSFSDASAQLYAAGVSRIFGLSTQDSDYQREAKQRLGLHYQLLSDEGLAFADAMRLPTFEWEGKRLTKRLTLAIEDGVVVKVWYPVFPSDRGAKDALEWLDSRKK